MSDELKSALDLAMEKLNREMGGPAPKLDDQQKAAIAEVRSRYSARIAQEEISCQQAIRSAIMAGDAEGAEKARKRLVDERRRLDAACEKEVEKIRSAKA